MTAPLAVTFASSPVSWPVLGIGLILLTYWLRVLQLVARTKRTVGRAANFVPPEPLGRVIRVIWMPTVTLWVLTPLFTAFLIDPPAILRPVPALYANPAIGWIAFIVAAAALAATWVCWRRMGTSWRMGIDPNERTQLVFTGPYAYVRHPIYALSSVLMVATMVACPSPLVLIVGVIHLLCLQWEARREEANLVALHGQPYVDYLANVGRFIPRLAGRRTTVPL